MREILFRGIPKDDTTRHFFADIWKDDCKGSFVYGSLIISKDRYYICVSALCQINSCINNGMTSMIEVIPESVSEFSGLTDKNGTKIFEGDIIRYADICEYRMYLESLERPEDYEENAFNDMWTIDEVVYGINIGYPAFDLNRHDWEVNGLSNLSESGEFYFEVIGNIHDNPELLGGGEE